MHAAHMRSLFLSGSSDEMSVFLKVELDQYAKKKDRLLDRIPAWQPLPQMEVASSPPESSQAHEVSWDLLDDGFRFMAATPFPSMGYHSRKLEHGVRCLPCTESFWAQAGDDGAVPPRVGRSLDMAISEAEIAEHIRKCPLVRQYWEHRNLNDNRA